MHTATDNLGAMIAYQRSEKIKFFKHHMAIKSQGSFGLCFFPAERATQNDF